MFLTPYYRSKGKQVLLAIAFGLTGFPLPGNSIPANETCVNVNGDIICYFKGSEKLLDWNDASQLCESFNSILPVIRNKNDQDAVAGYLVTQTDISFAWTAGKNFTHNNWTWINGKPLITVHAVQLNENEVLDGQQKDYAARDTDVRFTALAASEELPYICQSKGASCSSSSNTDVNDSCLRFSNDSRTWYDARNQCLKSGRDLAVIDDEAHRSKKNLTSSHRYWIGLRKKSWRWIRDDIAESNDEIEYTNWDSNVFSSDGECIFIDASNGRWRAVGCTETVEVVCQRAVSKESTTSGPQNSIPQSQLFGAVGAGIVVGLIICIIVIIVFALRTNKESVKEIGLSDSSPQNDCEELDNGITNTPVYALVNKATNAPVKKSDDVHCVYAEIPLATHNHSEDGATNQQPGIVYSTLEFKGDQAYVEPDKKRNHETVPTKIGPLGDIYAMPDAHSHEVTSPGNDSASPPVKVTPQGDIYALPVKPSKSPTTNIPGEVVYTNSQTEAHDQTK